MSSRLRRSGQPIMSSMVSPRYVLRSRWYSSVYSCEFDDLGNLDQMLTVNQGLGVSLDGLVRIHILCFGVHRA